MGKVANGVPKTQQRSRRKAMVITETSVPNGNDLISYLTNDTKVKNSVSPKETWKKLLEDSSIKENIITNTSKVEETIVCLDMEKHLELSNFVEKRKAHLTTVSRISHGSEDTLSSSDNNQQLKSNYKREHLSNSKNQGSTNSKNGADIVIPLKGKRKQTGYIKYQVYDDAFDITEHHTQSKKVGDLSNSTESSNTSFIKSKAPQHKLNKKKGSMIKQHVFDVSSPTALHHTKQLVKDTQSKSSNLNADSEITNHCHQPKILESRSSTDSILNVIPKHLLRKKASRPHGKNAFESLVDTCSNIEPIAEKQNKTGYISSVSASSISPVAVDVRHKCKKMLLKRGMFDSAVENPVVEDPVQNLQPNVNDPCSSRQQSKDISAELNVLKAPASPKIFGKINKKHLQHNLYESAVENEESVQQNVEEQQTDIASAKNYSRNTLATNVSADMDVLKGSVYPKIVGKINNKHQQHNFFESDVGSDNNNVEGQNSDIAMTKNYAQNTLAANTKESTDTSIAPKILRKILNEDKRGSIPPQTFKLSQNSQSLESRRQTNEGDNNASVNKLGQRKFLHSDIQTSVCNSPILPEFGRSKDSPGDSLTISKFRPKITSSKIYLAKDGVAEQYPHTSAAVQQKIASNSLNRTRNKKQIEQSDNPIVCQPKSTDNVSDETNYKKRKKCDSVCDNSLPSSDFTFDPDTVPHSTMVQSSSKKKCPSPAMHQRENKTRKSLLNSFKDSAEVSMVSDKNISVGTGNAGIRITSNGRERENELSVENKRNDNGTKISELQTNEHHSNTVEEAANFANKISVPENLCAVSDHKSFEGNISTMMKALPTNYNDVSRTFGHASRKTKSLGKSRSVNSQEELINADSKNEKKQKGNSKNVSGELKNSLENIVCGEVIKPRSLGGDNKSSVSMLCMGQVSSDSASKTHENSYRNEKMGQISPLDTLAQKMCSLEGEEINPRKSDRVNLIAKKRKSSSYSLVAVSLNTLSDTGGSIENISDNAEAPNCREEHCTWKETPELRASLSLSASHLNKTSHKDAFSLNFKNSSERSVRARKKNSTVSNITNAKIIYSNSPDLSNLNNDKSLDDCLKGGLYTIRQTENERGSYMDIRPHLTEDDAADGAPGEKSVISGKVRELSPPLLSAPQVNTPCHKENFTLNVENSSEMRSKEINKNLVTSNISDAKITDSDSSGASNTNNDKRPYDFLKDSSHRNRQTGTRRQSNPDNQPQLIRDNDGTEGERPVSIRQPLKDNIHITHQKKVDAKQTRPKAKAHASFLNDVEQYKPKLIRPKRWINQRLYKKVGPTFKAKYGLEDILEYEKFALLLCNAVTSCIRNRKNWDAYVDQVQDILFKYLSINTYVDFLVFAHEYLPDEFVFKMGLTYEKRCKK